MSIKAFFVFIFLIQALIASAVATPKDSVANNIPATACLSPVISCGASTTTSVSFNWTALAGATSYAITYTVNAGAVQNGGSIIGTGYAVNGLNQGDVVSITVTPTGSGCYNASTANCVSNVCPVTSVNVPANSAVCSGATVPASSFTSNPAGATFTWTNTNTSIGLAASGTGNTPGFTAVNTSSSPVTATITVTPSVGLCTGTPNTYTITVNPDATASLTSSSNTANQSVCINTPITPITYTIGGGGTSAAVTGMPAGVTGSYAAGVLTISGIPTVSSVFAYTVTTTGTCAQYTLTGTITVNPNPTITLTSASNTTNQNICINTAITPITYAIGGTATGAIVTGLPAGVTGTLVSNVFTISGTPTSSAGSPYTYTVTTTGGCGSQILSGTITVNVSPTIALTSASNTRTQTVCNGTAITPITYAIGGSGTGATLTHVPPGIIGVYAANVFTISGTPTSSIGSPYTYTVTTTGTCSPQQATSGTIVVIPIPTISVTTTNPTTCGGSDGTFTVNGLAASTTYTINYTKSGITQIPISTTSSSGGSISVSGLTQGSYTNITATTATNCSSNAATASLSDPVAFTPTPGTSGPVCEGSALSLTSTTTTGAIFAWTGPNGFNANIQNPTIPTTVFADSGTYTLTVMVAGCVSTAAIVGMVHQKPIINITTPQTYSANLQTSSLGVTVSSGTVTSTAGTVVNTSGNNWTISNIPSNNVATVTVTSPTSCSQTMFVDTLTPVHPGSSFKFIATTPASGNTYQWQVNTGSGFTDLTNNSIYSNVTTDTLIVTNAPSTTYGYQYQCVITNNSVITYSLDYPLQFVEIWTGGINSSWENPGNWSSGTLPDSNTDVYINGGTVVLNSNVSVRSLTLSPAASFTVNSGFNITVAH